MKIFLSILILVFSLQSFTKADDISEFQIEGMSIGDSLLVYFSEVEIKNPGSNNLMYYPKSRKFYEIVLDTNTKLYDEIQFSLKDKDSSYKIYNINGTIYFNQEIDKCYDKQNEIEANLKKIFNLNNINIYPESGKHAADSSGKSTFKAKWFVFKTNDHIGIVCTDYHKDKNLQDSLKLLISSREYNEFLINEAY